MRSISLSACFISSIDSFVLVLGELLQAPVAEHAGVQEVLVDRGELVVQHLVEVLDDLRVAFHACDCTPKGATGQALSY